MKSIDNIDKRDKIAQALNKNLPISVKEESPQAVDHLQDDYEASRETYKELITKGNEAIDLMMELAKDSQHPRAFEVLATLLKTQADNNDKLLELQKRLKQLKEPAKGVQSSNVTNNNVFVGSTTDLQRFILDQKKNPKVIDVDDNSNP
jgi:thioredoxin-like negative regulator of GroEL